MIIRTITTTYHKIWYIFGRHQCTSAAMNYIISSKPNMNQPLHNYHHTNCHYVYIFSDTRYDHANYNLSISCLWTITTIIINPHDWLLLIADDQRVSYHWLRVAIHGIDQPWFLMVKLLVSQNYTYGWNQSAIVHVITLNQPLVKYDVFCFKVAYPLP